MCIVCPTNTYANGHNVKKGKQHFHGSLCHCSHSRSIARKCVFFSVFVFRLRVIINAPRRLLCLNCFFFRVVNRRHEYGYGWVAEKKTISKFVLVSVGI